MSDAIYNITRCNELRIYDIISELYGRKKVEFLDFTVIGLTARPAVYTTGGIKISQEYWNDQADWVVRKFFTYYDTGVLIRFEWAKYDGTVGLWKEEFKPLNNVEVAKLERANRERTIIYLQATAKGTAIEPYVTAILKHYKTEIDLWVLNSTLDWKDAILAETDTTINAYLDIQTREPSEQYSHGLTVREGILEQIDLSWVYV